MTRSHPSPVPSKSPARVRGLPEIGPELRSYRRAEGISQSVLAGRLQVDQSYVSRIERGERPVRDVGFLLQVARLLEIEPERLGLSRELVRSVNQRASSRATMATAAAAAHDPVVADQDQWRSTRHHLNHHRAELARLATDLYEPELRVASTTLLAPPAWMPPEPIDLDRVALDWVPEEQSGAVVTGAEPEAWSTLPMRSSGHRYDHYTSAMRYLNAPALFENRPSYRLLDVAWSEHGGRLQFGVGTYFDKLDVAEVLGHELAALHRQDPSVRPSLADLPFRFLVGDPFDPARRALLPAVTTLTLRRDRARGTASFLLHWRDPGQVATAAGIYDVIPAGEFQPSSVAVWDQHNDFDLWRNIVREFSEELLGTPEHDGSRSAPIDYDEWRLFRQLQQACTEGRVSASCLGVAVDALTLAPTILTALVIDDDVFDEVCREAVETNAEGIVISGPEGTRGTGLPFTDRCVTRFLSREPMASPGAGCLALAWQSRPALLQPRRG